MKTIKRTYLLLCGAMLCLLIGCEIQENFEYQKSGTTGELGVTAWEFIQANDSLTLLESAISKANLESLYNGMDARTFIAPTNQAFKQYLATNAYASLEEVPLPILKNTLKYHIVKEVVLFTNPDLAESNNPIAYDTENGQLMFLSHNTNYQGLVNEETSKQWTIVTSNLEPKNGAIHVVSSIVYFSAPAGNLNIPDSSVKTDTIYPHHDTYINGGSSSGVNYGGDVLIKVKNVTDNGDYDRKGFLMFDLKDFDDEGVITDVKLEMAVKFTAAKGVAMNLFTSKDTLWNETSLTFDNATLPEGDPIASLTTTKISTFAFDVTDYYNSLDNKQKVSFVLDGEPGTDETDEFATKENTTHNAPILIATIASGNNVLVLQTNKGFTVQGGETFVLSNEIVEVTGADASDIIYNLEEAPLNGWLIRGADILKPGDRFTQFDVNSRNMIYISNGSGTSDGIVVSARDRAGSSLESFLLDIAIQ
ncbi:CBM96 family carbohydrate-binding protein [Zunongwangia endophytica]|uniref:DNRLRE domain-containing protein n=1 Tax=Zunongwangia endophytica TaxID=1808945 RepID=A0ABV8HBZ1_9FLAO|nr:DNRLRE domain-containing protein [Zunongwangia endophytica]MDN3593438.1 DNRLRE domain-containing protein [Zunongwangia endophytica]